MGIKGKLIGFTVGKAIEKISSSGAIDNAINSLLDKAGKYSGMKTTEEYIEKSTSKNYLIIKSHSFSVGSIAGFFSGKMPDGDFDKYQVYDKNNKLKYFSNTDTNFVTDKDTITICASNKKRIGEIKEYTFNVGVPLLEKEVKKCAIKIGNERLCVLKKYESFGEIEFESIEGDIRIKHTKGKEFVISRNNKTILKLHTVPLNLKDGYVDKFVVEYDNIEDEKIAVLIAIGIDTIIT